jgi:hypothetical protein
MSALEWLEAASYVVTIIGLPLAIAVFLHEQRKERQNDDEELYLQLANEYERFLRLCLENADLRLTTSDPDTRTPLSPEQAERRDVLFEILISLFERAYILVYEESMNRQTARLWQTWEDYMRAWVRRIDFRERLPVLLEGEDPDFVAHIRRLAEAKEPGVSGPGGARP